MSNQTSENNKRVAKNTLILYARMFFTVGISFYSTRLILANLGVENYGIYNVIGGFVSMFYMVSATMTLAVGRFLTFELGTGNFERLKKTFSTSVNVLLLLSLLIVLIAETIGLWFVNEKLNISADRMIAANWIYQLTIISFVLEIMSVPYTSSVISHEKMGAFAFVTVLKVLLTLFVAIVLAVSPIDTLVFYGILVLLINVMVQLLYWVYCRKNFAECRYSFYLDRSIFKQMFGFAGWFFISTSTAMMSSQGVNILLNMSFGTLINAARGVCGQINGTVGAFSSNFMKALNPQITKTYAAGNFEQTKTLVCRGAKFSYLLFFIIALPCMLEVDFFLSVWLKEVPPYAGVFVQLTLLNALVSILLNTIETLNAASGKIRNYQILNCIIQSLIFVLTMVALYFKAGPILAIAIGNIVNIIAFYPRVAINKFAVGISFSYYFKHVVKGVLFMSVGATLVCLLLMQAMHDGWIRLIMVCVLSTISCILLSFLLVLTKGERDFVLGYVSKKMKSIKK